MLGFVKRQILLSGKLAVPVVLLNPRRRQYISNANAPPIGNRHNPVESPKRAKLSNLSQPTS